MVWTPRDVRIVISGSRPVSASGAAIPGSGADPGGDERGGVPGEHGRGDSATPARVIVSGGAERFSSGRATQTIASEPSTATLLQNSVRAGRDQDAASSPTETA